MIHDPKIEVTCDGEGCVAITEVEPKYVYGTVFGSGGQYDCSEQAVEKAILLDNWTIVNGKHFCENCSESED